MNYLNKFGQSAKNYMTYDNVSELYYAAVRYFENLGNVSDVDQLGGHHVEGREPRSRRLSRRHHWSGKDPISYACQKNFILGIGDDHTHYDYNVGGRLTSTGTRRQARGREPRTR
jgi:type IV pilus assembly protein PilY1